MPWRLIAFIIIAPAIFVAVMIGAAFALSHVLNLGIDRVGMTVAAIGAYIVWVWILVRRTRP